MNEPKTKEQLRLDAALKRARELVPEYDRLEPKDLARALALKHHHPDYAAAANELTLALLDAPGGEP